MSVLEILGVAESGRWVASLLVVRATGTFLLAALAILLLRRASAAARHAALALTVAALLGLPFLAGLLPRWELELLPARPSVLPTAIPAAPSLRVEGLRAALPSMVQPTGARDELAAGTEPVDRAPAKRVDRRSLVSGWPLSTWLLVLWLAGIGAGLAQLLLAVFLVRRTARGAVPMVEPDWLGALAHASAHLGLTRRVCLLSSPAVGVPVVYGYWDSVVLLPHNASAWPEDRRRAFLLHELAHVARHDCLTQTLAYVARLVYWPNPLAWWLVRRLRAEAERACDDRVLTAGTPASDYAAHLLDAARDLSRARRPLAVLAVVERSRLEDRLLALLDPGLRRGALTGRSLAFGAGLSLIAACSVAALQPVARAVVARAVPLARRPGAELRPAPAAQVPPAAPVAPSVDPAAPTRATGRLAEPATEVAPEVFSGASSNEVEFSVATAASEGGVPVRGGGVATDRAAGEGGSAPGAKAPAGAAQAMEVPVIRISTELIQIDAVVTDKTGRQVVDLRPEDFEVFDNGHRQAVSRLVYVKTGQGPTTGDEAALLAVAQTFAPRTLVLVVDDITLSLESAVRVRRTLKKFVDTLGPADRAVIVKTSEGGPRNTSLTSDHATLRTAAESVRVKVWNISPTGTEPAQADEVNWQILRALDSLSALKATIDSLRAIPGRKAVIYFSEGLPLLSNNDEHARIHSQTYRFLDTLYEDSGLRAALNSMTDLANRASVVIYTLDATGLTTGGPDSRYSASGYGSPTVRQFGPSMSAASGASLTSGSGSSMMTALEESRGGVGQARQPALQAARDASSARTGRQESLMEIAEQTGGLAVHDQNDLGDGLARILADHAGYYLIGYEPERGTFEKVGGSARFHQVKVEVKRAGLSVRSRKGFYGVSDEVIAKSMPASTN